MKKNVAVMVAMALCPAVFLSSCVYDYPTYMGGGYAGAYYDSGYEAWTPASYDADGFPIYGYSYGRPVYGYTSAGVAIFTLAALTAACTVPLWAPASWYRGHYHYPHGIHHHHCPPHYPHDHCPHIRPKGGMNAPIHKTPHKVLEANRVKRPQQFEVNKHPGQFNVAKERPNHLNPKFGNNGQMNAFNAKPDKYAFKGKQPEMQHNAPQNIQPNGMKHGFNKQFNAPQQSMNVQSSGMKHGFNKQFNAPQQSMNVQPSGMKHGFNKQFSAPQTSMNVQLSGMKHGMNARPAAAAAPSMPSGSFMRHGGGNGGGFQHIQAGGGHGHHRR